MRWKLWRRRPSINGARMQYLRTERLIDYPAPAVVCGATVKVVDLQGTVKPTLNGKP